MLLLLRHPSQPPHEGELCCGHVGGRETPADLLLRWEEGPFCPAPPSEREACLEARSCRIPYSTMTSCRGPVASPPREDEGAGAADAPPPPRHVLHRFERARSVLLCFVTDVSSIGWRSSTTHGAGSPLATSRPPR